MSKNQISNSHNRLFPDPCHRSFLLVGLKGFYTLGFLFLRFFLRWLVDPWDPWSPGSQFVGHTPDLADRVRRTCRSTLLSPLCCRCFLSVRPDIGSSENPLAGWKRHLWLLKTLDTGPSGCNLPLVGKFCPLDLRLWLLQGGSRRATKPAPYRLGGSNRLAPRLSVKH